MGKKEDAKRELDASQRFTLAKVSQFSSSGSDSHESQGK